MGPVSRRRKRALTPKGLTAAATVVVAALVGCGSSGSSSPTAASSTYPNAYGSIPAASGSPKSGGTISVAEQPGAGPAYIFPITPSNLASVFGVYDFQYLMWRPLYWSPGTDGVSPQINTQLSLASMPVYSNGNKTVTITLNSGSNALKWSDGTPVTGNDVVFFIDLVKAAVKENAGNFSNYTPGDFPDNIASATVSSSNKYQVTLQLTTAPNPGWFTDNELSLIVPMPSAQWAKASASGPTLDYTNPANAKAIYDFLNKASTDVSTYASNPLWQVVDGPYKLSSYTSSNTAATLVANSGYTGPNKPNIQTVNEVPYTSSAAEFTALKAGDLTVGELDPSDIGAVQQLKSQGYNVFGYPDFGFNYMAFNFKDTTGDFNNIISQLYVRQALAHLVDQQGIISGVYKGAAIPAYGPIPSYPKSPYQPSNAVKAPYPFSTSDAQNLLTSHGWKEVNGVMTCESAGTGSNQCGSGIPVGTKLEFNLVYATATSNLQEQSVSFASEAKKIGVIVNTSGQTFNYIISNYSDVTSPQYQNDWAMVNFGGFTNSLYPTTNTLFNTGGTYNIGGFSSPQIDQDIKNSISGGDPTAVKTEASDVATQLPGLFLPAQDVIFVWKNNLEGPAWSFATMTQYFLNPEAWYLK